MATLTIEQIKKMRRTIGDSKPDDAGAYDLKDGDIQAAWDDAGSDWWMTAVDLLEQRRGIWVNEIDTITLDGAGQTRSQKVANIERLLSYARDRAGVGESRLQIGAFDEGLAEDDPTNSS